MTSPATPRVGLPPLIPREVLFGNPVRTQPRISPDGRHIAYLAPDAANVLQVWVRTRGQQDDHPVTADPKRGVRIFTWAYDHAHLLYLQDADGDEKFHLFAVNLATATTRDLTPFPGVNAGVIDVTPHCPDEVLVQLNQRDPHCFDVYRLRISTGELTCLAENPGSVLSWTCDMQRTVRAAVAMEPNGGRTLLLRDAAAAPWRAVRTWPADEEVRTACIAADGNTLYLLANHDANAMRLLALDMTTLEERVIAADPQYDITSVMVDAVTHELQAYAVAAERLTWHLLDPALADLFVAFSRVTDGDLHQFSRTPDGRLWLAGSMVDDGPTRFYLYDREAGEVEYLFSNQPALDDLTLAKMAPVSYRSRDGLTIHGYLMTPVGLPADNLPAILSVHGGPWGRDMWCLDAEAQWLANRGYAVLQVNFRGSAGYGKAFLNAGNREWGGKMHDDLLDGVHWLIAQGIADPKRVAIMGWSYGGYATLVGLTFTPEVFAAGVDGVGPSNLKTLLDNAPPYWKPIMPLFEKRVGDLDDVEFLHSRSPLFFADRIQAPLLIGQGANDPRVTRLESDQLVAAARGNGKEVDYVLYTDEGHGFARPENRLHFYALAEAFLARHLGGRAEPAGDIPGHSGIMR